MPAHASRSRAPAPSAPPSGPERRLLAPARPRHRPANAGTPAKLSGSPASRPVMLRSVDPGLLAAASMIRAAVPAGMPAHPHARALSAPEPRLLVSAQPGARHWQVAAGSGSRGRIRPAARTSWVARRASPPSHARPTVSLPRRADRARRRAMVRRTPGRDTAERRRGKASASAYQQAVHELGVDTRTARYWRQVAAIATTRGRLAVVA